MTAATGGSVFSRVIRGSAMVAGSYVLSQGLRLASNLVLTRLLYPEAFGLMALVSLVLMGLAMFSDIGLGPAIQSHPRGDEPGFLNTAYSIQLMRGLVLALLCLGLGWPMAALYDAPELAWLIPVAGLQMLITGAFPTRIESANRHLTPGRVMAIDLVSQVAALALMVGLALATKSVWALVWGSVAGAAVKLVLCDRFLPGHRDRPGWDPTAAAVLWRYGAWIFLSTAFGFALFTGDKAVLGLYLSLEALGIYNVGYFLASFPMLLAMAVTGRLLVPLYARVREDGSPDAARRLRRMRVALSAVIFSLLAFMALAGPALVDLLYDARYSGAGAVVVAVAIMQLPQLLVFTLDPAALAFGNSKVFFAITALRAIVQMTLFVLGAHYWGLAGALAGQALSGLICAPASMALAQRNGVWDPRHDVVFALASVGLVACVLGLNPDLAARLAAI